LRLAAAQTEVPATEMQAASPAPDFANTYPPLWDGLGTLSYKITTTDPQAQAYFDQGLILTYGFNHDEARRAFREAQRRDPDCAMCFWGEALVLGPNINMPFPEEAVAPAYAAAQKAQALAASNTKNPVTARERALITALATRYSADPKADRAVLDAAYAAAMGEASKLFPDDNDVAVLFAEAVMDLSPWDYWKPGGAEPNPRSAPIVPTLERVLGRDPNHPGALHYYIHAVEASDRPRRAEAAADRLRGALPGAGHMVHMPSHIYYRIGRYFDALAVNKDAVVARRPKATARPQLRSSPRRPRCRTSCVIPNHLIGITRCGSRSRPRCCRLTGSTRRSTSFGRRSRARRTTAGPIT